MRLVSLTCYYQTQTFTAGISNTNPLANPNYNQQQQQQYANYGQLALPSITCSPTANSCFKFVCFGTSKCLLQNYHDTNEQLKR